MHFEALGRFLKKLWRVNFDGPNTDTQTYTLAKLVSLTANTDKLQPPENDDTITMDTRLIVDIPIIHTWNLLVNK